MTASVLAEVKANHAALNACRGPHAFLPVVEAEEVPGAVAGTKRLREFTRRWRCAKCLGEVDSHALHWYLLGLVHGCLPK